MTSEAATTTFRWGPAIEGDEVRFRLWAPAVEKLSLRLRGEDVAMEPAGDGWFEVEAPARPGDDYAFVLPDGQTVPDPASRQQADGVSGPSLVVDPSAYRWTTDWGGRPWAEAVILEIHIGTFTEEGTFRAAAERLAQVAEAGFTAVEVMPVAQFGGSRGWGYDGTLLFAPHPAYGTPDEMRAFVDAAHGHGLMVFLDVVYNHFGPEGNYLGLYAPEFFHADRGTPWGAAIAYEKPAVRAFVLENALTWLRDFRIDGLRLDAVDHVRDEASDKEILVEIAERLRAAFPDRPVHLATEDNRNITRLHPYDSDGRPLLHTAEWNDDFHNVVHVIATGETEGYYEDFAEHHWALFGRALAEGFAYQGEPSRYGGARRGEPSAHQPPLAFVDFLQNHDQVGNRAFGERLTSLAPEPLHKALTAILLMSPHVPLLFMGEEWGETRPFAFFTDYEGDLADAVREGRRSEFRHFAAFRGEGDLRAIPDPNDPATFAASRVDWAHRETPEGRAWLELTRGLIEVRMREIVPHLAKAPGNGGQLLLADDDGGIAVDWQLDGAVLRLRANLGDAPASLPPAAGRTIWGEATDPAAPRSVHVTIEES